MAVDLVDRRAARDVLDTERHLPLDAAAGTRLGTPPEAKKNHSINVMCIKTHELPLGLRLVRH